jgi:hypothetical protein
MGTEVMAGGACSLKFRRKRKRKKMMVEMSGQDSRDPIRRSGDSAQRK